MTVRTRPLSLLIAAALFLAPLNLFFKWGETSAYVGGIFSDYLLQKLWVGEIPALLAILVWCWQKIRTPHKKIALFLKKNAWLLLMIAALGIRQIFTPLPAVSVWYFLKLTELGLFTIVCIDAWPNLHQKLIQATVCITAVFQAIVVIVQFIRQSPLFEYSVLGETQFTGTINVARAVFAAGEVMLPYGTTAHPNIAGGVLVLLAAGWLHLVTQHRRAVSWKKLVFIGFITWAIFLTQSASALCAWGAFGMWHAWPWLKHTGRFLAPTLIVLFPALLLLVPAQWQTESFDRRNFLNAHAVANFTRQPLTGTGLGLFTTTLKNASYSNEYIRFIQPTHNVPILWLAETGLLGISFLIVLIKKIAFPQKTWWLLTLVPLISLDHYLLTQWSGGLLAGVVLAFLWRGNHD